MTGMLERKLTQEEAIQEAVRRIVAAAPRLSPRRYDEVRRILMASREPAWPKQVAR